MTWVATAIAGSAVLGAGASIYSGNKQAAAANNASSEQMQQFNTINQQEAPYRQAGTAALNSINGLSSYFNTPMTAKDLSNNLSPSYNFGLEQGLGQAQNEANSTGGLLNGNTLQGLNTYAQNYAQTGAQQAFNNYSTNQNNIYNRLASIAGIGQTGQTQANQAGINAVNQATGYQTSGAAAQAAGAVGATNALGSGLVNATTWYQAPSIMNGLNGANSGSTSSVVNNGQASQGYDLSVLDQ